jgi:two-component system sensor histidine kinase YesM
MAVVNKNEHIKNMTASLMRLVNVSFRSEGSHITLKEEKENLISYVHIMKVRFGNRIDLRFSIPEEMMEFKIRKMLLQPLVENAIIHGFLNGAKRGVILIQTCRNEEKLLVRITDNGTGMERDAGGENQVSGEVPGVFTSLGIESVNRRIHLNYGENFGLEINSRVGFFTSMTLNLPLIGRGVSHD